EGSADQWKLGEDALMKATQRLNLKVKVMPDEAAFYGPKIDMKLVDAIGRLWQLSTVQFDFTLPRRFGLEYIAEDGKKHQPLMVHRALFGSVERFFGSLLGPYAAAFPGWVAAGVLGAVSGSIVCALVSLIAARDDVVGRALGLRPDAADHGPAPPPISVLKPLSRAEDQIELHLRTFSAQRYEPYEILF